MVDEDNYTKKMVGRANYSNKEIAKTCWKVGRTKIGIMARHEYPGIVDVYD